MLEYWNKIINETEKIMLTNLRKETNFPYQSINQLISFVIYDVCFIQILYFVDFFFPKVGAPVVLNIVDYG